MLLDLHVDLTEFTLERGGRRLRLPSRWIALEIVALLNAHPGRVHEDVIAWTIWDQRATDPNVHRRIERHLGRLRLVLRRSGDPLWHDLAARLEGAADTWWIRPLDE